MYCLWWILRENRLPDFSLDTKAQFCFSFKTILLCRICYWPLMELVEKMLATLLALRLGLVSTCGRVWSWEQAWASEWWSYLSPLSTATSPLAAAVPAHWFPLLSLPLGRRQQPSIYWLHSSSECCLACFRQNQVDYLKPLIRLLKIILLAFGFVFFFLKCSGEDGESCSVASWEGSWAVQSFAPAQLQLGDSGHHGLSWGFRKSFIYRDLSSSSAKARPLVPTGLFFPFIQFLLLKHIW